MSQNELPKISAATRDKLNSYGLTNHLYDYLQLPSAFIPRGAGFNAYTYLIMGLSVVGGVLSKRYGSVTYPFVYAFIGAPLAAFYQKKQADFNYISDISQKDPALLLQRFPVLKQSFEQVNAEADAQIAKYEERLRLIQSESNRSKQ